MPSIETIANEVKAIVIDIRTDTGVIKTNTTTIKADATAIKNNTNTIITQLNQINATAQSGFSNLAQGINLLIQLQAQNNDLLAANNEQNKTIICELSNIADVLCDIKRNTDKEVKLQTGISRTLTHIDDIFELANGNEAIEVANRYALEAKIAKCCPDKEEPPQPCFEECKPPKTPDYKPIKTDWKPIDFPREQGPK
jgi:soluble cytochrome b562